MKNALSLGNAKPTGPALFLMPDSPEDLPLFRAMKTAESAEVLARNSVGRIAFAAEGRVEMLPVHYNYVNGWIYGRTAAPACLPAGVPVAFQIEERTPSREWRSVVVQGRLDLVESDGAAPTASFALRAGALIRRMVGHVPTDPPPVAFRDQLFAVHAVEVCGRISLPLRSRSRVS